MSENNPYTAPTSKVENDAFVAHESRLLDAPVSVGAGRGWGWISEGFGYFKRSPGAWILGLIVGFVLIVVLQFIPLIGPILYMLSLYVLVGGVMLGCHAQSQGQPFRVSHLFAAAHNPVKLIILSVIMLFLSAIIMVSIFGPGYFSMFSNPGEPEAVLEAIGDPETVLFRTLVSMLFFIPVSMAIWFAPALIAINDVPVGKALRFSFMGCLKNVLPFLLFGLLAVVFYILAAIPLGLGLLVFFPTFTAATYVAYREIFTQTT